MRRSALLLRVTLFLLLGVGSSASAFASPITYSYSTVGPLLGPVNALTPFFTGLSLSGTFGYDSSAPATSTSSAGTSYADALTFINGTVGAWSFSDPDGYEVLVGNERPFFGSVADRIIFNSEPSSGSASASDYNLNGFAVGGYTLVLVQPRWAEYDGNPDFLTSESLPTVLPTFPGRIALWFAPTGTSGPQLGVAFEMTASPVPELSTLVLLVVGLASLALLSARERLSSR